MLTAPLSRNLLLTASLVAASCAGTSPMPPGPSGLPNLRCEKAATVQLTRIRVVGPWCGKFGGLVAADATNVSQCLAYVRAFKDESGRVFPSEWIYSWTAPDGSGGTTGGFEADFCLEADPLRCQAQRAKREAKYFDQEILPGQKLQFHLNIVMRFDEGLFDIRLRFEPRTTHPRDGIPTPNGAVQERVRLRLEPVAKGCWKVDAA